MDVIEYSKKLKLCVKLNCVCTYDRFNICFLSLVPLVIQYYGLLLLVKYQTSDLTLLIILHHLSISLACYKAMCHARIYDSKWEPSIYVDITPTQGMI